MTANPKLKRDLEELKLTIIEVAERIKQFNREFQQSQPSKGQNEPTRTQPPIIN